MGGGNVPENAPSRKIAGLQKLVNLATVQIQHQRGGGGMYRTMGEGGPRLFSGRFPLPSFSPASDKT